jgi:hypothetical protein
MKAKELGHVRNKPDGSEVSRRGFMQSALATVLVAGLAASPLSFFSGTAKAQSVKVQGVAVERMNLTDTVRNLDKASAQYRSRDDILRIQKKVASTVTIDAQKGSSMGVSYVSADGTAKVWGIDFSEFAKLVKQVTGKDVIKAKLIAEFTTEKGEQVINIFALPLDANGNPTKYNGGYLAVGASYFPSKGKVYGGRALLFEPGTTVASIEE